METLRRALARLEQLWVHLELFWYCAAARREHEWAHKEAMAHMRWTIARYDSDWP